MAADLYIGLMSGTSVDSIDAALVAIDDNRFDLVATYNHPVSPGVREQILALCRPGVNEIERLGELDRQIGLAFAEAALNLLTEAGVPPGQIRAIGSHGQTVRHRPPSAERDRRRSFTLQIGDPHTIALRTGITTVADFRRRDIAAGGQGAPLVPLFHQQVFAGDTGRAVINIGGMANVTGLFDGKIIGFDTGPGNALLDEWVSRHRGSPYDRDGAWAATGQVDDTLLGVMLADPYFAAAPPKSTGREQFNLDWLVDKLASTEPPPADVQATLTELTARTIVDAIEQLPEPVNELYVCGGGAFNWQLMQRLAALAAPRPVVSTASLGVDPQWVEAMAFAWLASLTISHRAIDTGAVTGATRAVVLGAIHPA